MNIKHLRELESAATPGPWRADVSRPDDVVIWSGPRGEEANFVTNVGPTVITVGVACDGEAADALLIVELRNNATVLFDRLEEAEVLLSEVRSLFNAMHNAYVSDDEGDVVEALPRSVIEVLPEIRKKLAEFFR